ncbi:F-box protein PP2-B15 [Henckelia pumila]|uniref:F-box protein PP2-B15 n=1 Tax=Henckelia pumila TaxID=405737 RepID=UPI003C6E0998
MACDSSSISRLPEDCVSRILSLTSPKDSCKMLAVSKQFRAPAESNLVWDRFLPTDYAQILPSINTCPTRDFQSKKELFLTLSDYVLVDGGKKAFGVDKSSGTKCYIISARDLSIFSDGIDNIWSWKSIPESRFCEVAELVKASLLQIQGRIRSQTLSPNTNYGAYLIIRISDRAYGLDSIPCEISVASNVNTAYLRDPDSKKQQFERLLYGNRAEMLKKRVDQAGDERVPRKRDDGWMEIELGQFFNGQGTGDDEEMVVISLMEIKGHQFKSGLIVEGIQVRPKNSLN